MTGEKKRCESCPYCKKGLLEFKDEEMAITQQTDRGEVYCRVVVPMGACPICGSRTMHSSGTQIIDTSVKRARDKLPE